MPFSSLLSAESVELESWQRTRLDMSFWGFHTVTDLAHKPRVSSDIKSAGQEVPGMAEPLPSRGL